MIYTTYAVDPFVWFQFWIQFSPREYFFTESRAAEGGLVLLTLRCHSRCVRHRKDRPTRRLALSTTTHCAQRSRHRAE